MTESYYNNKKHRCINTLSTRQVGVLLPYLISQMIDGAFLQGFWNTGIYCRLCPELYSDPPGGPEISLYCWNFGKVSSRLYNNDSGYIMMGTVLRSTHFRISSVKSAKCSNSFMSKLTPTTVGVYVNWSKVSIFVFRKCRTWAYKRPLRSVLVAKTFVSMLLLLVVGAKLSYTRNRARSRLLWFFLNFRIFWLWSIKTDLSLGHILHGVFQTPPRSKRVTIG